jgi:hypothetical protein
LLPDFNLSGNESLRTLEITGESIRAADDTAPNFLKTVLSSVPPSAPLDVVIIYRGCELCGRGGPDSEPFCSNHSSQEIWDKNVLSYQRQLMVFREMYNTRDFRLVLCADVPDFMVEHALEILGRIVDVGMAMGGLSRLHEPLVISERRTLLTRYIDRNAGCLREWYVPASAL